jgi:hypothetical protein
LRMARAIPTRCRSPPLNRSPVLPQPNHKSNTRDYIIASIIHGGSTTIKVEVERGLFTFI